MATTVYTQLTGYPVNGGDIPAVNNSGSDIAAGKTLKADTAYEVGESQGIGVLVTSGAGGRMVALETLKANGGQGRARALGGAVTTATSAIVPFGLVTTDSSGQVAPWSSGAWLGYTLTGASAGDQCIVFVLPGGA